MSRYAHHLFVCVNARPAQGRRSCAASGSEALLEQLERQAVTDPRLVGRVAVTRSGCLGPCFDGPNLVVYPEGIWYAGVTADDVEEIVESHLIGGCPVARLRYEWPDDDDG